MVIKIKLSLKKSGSIYLVLRILLFNENLDRVKFSDSLS